MKRRLPLFLVTAASFLGTLMSGFLTWRNKFGGGCPITQKTWLTCGGVTIFGQPTCIYGFVMFLAVLILSLMAWKATAGRNIMKTILGLTILGTCFSGGLAIYEIWFLVPRLPSTPACVYGFFFYVIALISAVVLLRAKQEIVPAEPPQASPL